MTDVAANIRRVIVEDLPPLSSSAPQASLPKIWNIPSPLNPFFPIGRDETLARICRRQAG